MTKGQLLEALRDVPLSADVRIYDSRTNEYPDFTINTTEQFDYESQMPIVIIQIESGESGQSQENDNFIVEQLPESHKLEDTISGFSDPKEDEAYPLYP